MKTTQKHHNRAFQEHLLADNLKALYSFPLIKAKTEASREHHRKKDVASDYQINAKSSGEQSFVVQEKCQSVRNVDFPETVSKRCVK